MARPGIRIRNGSNVLVVDSAFKNLCQYSAGSVTSGGTSTGEGYYPATITVPYRPTSVIAVRAPNGVPTALIASNISGGNISYTFYMKANGAVLQYIVYDDPNYIGLAAGPGIRIRNPNDGTVAFDSRAKYMRVTNFASGVPADWPNFTLTQSGTNPYVVFVQNMIQYSVVNDPTNPAGGPKDVYWECLVANWSGDAVNFSEDLLASALFPGGSVVGDGFRTYSYAFMTVDGTVT